MKRKTRIMPRIVVFAALAFALSACMGTTTSQTEKDFTERLLFGGNKLPPQPEAPPREYGCPTLEILDGAGTYRVGDQSASGLSHQAAILDIARECKPEGNVMRIKIGVQGRFTLGAGGKPGTYSIPVRVAVRSKGQVLQSRMVPTSISVSGENDTVPFVVVDENLTVAITADDPAELYTILVGLDPQGARQPAGKKKQRR